MKDLLKNLFAQAVLEVGENGAAGAGSGGGELQRVAWDGKMDDSMILMVDDTGEDIDEIKIVEA